MTKVITNTTQRFRDVLDMCDKDRATIFTPRITLGGLGILKEIFPHPTMLDLILQSKEDILSVKSEDLSLDQQIYQHKTAKEVEEWLKKIGITVTKSNIHTSLTPMAFLTHKNKDLTVVGNHEISRECLKKSDTFIENGICVEDLGAKSNLLQVIGTKEDTKENLNRELDQYSKSRSPAFLYYYTLWHLFKDSKGGSSKILKDNPTLEKTQIWQTLYPYQRDGAIAILNKLEENGGCILADSVGLGKTYTALAVIQAYQMQNLPVAVFCPKRLEENWNQFIDSSNGRTPRFRNENNVPDFHYRLFSHTQLTPNAWNRANGSGELFGLIVIDESHNFRNKTGRYNFLLENVIARLPNVKILMLTATPINNNVKDLKNQIALLWKLIDRTPKEVKENFDEQISKTLKDTNATITAWQQNYTSSPQTTPPLAEWLSPAYYNLLAKYTIARNRYMIQKHYTIDIKFPQKEEVDEYVSLIPGNSINIKTILDEVIEMKFAAYNQASYFTLEQNMVLRFLCTNIIKRLESSIVSAKETLTTMIKYAKDEYDLIDRQNTYKGIREVEEEESEDDISLLEDNLNRTQIPIEKEKNKKELLADIKYDIDILQSIKVQLEQLLPDAKLEALLETVTRIKNETSRSEKILIFTAYKDTAKYLYEAFKARFQHRSYKIALTLGGGITSVCHGSNDFGNTIPFDKVLQLFSPMSHRTNILNQSPIDILIATDCISEGQNLQDCRYIINYDIHWNPVRLIQRIGRIDRIGSMHNKIRIINFWPTKDLDEYLRLKERVNGRFKTIATLEDQFRDIQLKEIKNGMLSESSDLEQKRDVPIQDYTPFVLDLNQWKTPQHIREFEVAPLGIHAVTSNVLTKAFEKSDIQVPDAGIIFLLREKEMNSKKARMDNYFLSVINADGSPYGKSYRIDNMKVLSLYQALCKERTNVDNLPNSLENQFKTLDPICLNATLDEAIRQTKKENKADLTLASYLVIGDPNKLGGKPSVPAPPSPPPPVPPAPPLPKTPDEAYSKGLEAFEKGDYSNAGYYLDFAIKLDRNQANNRYDDAILILAQLYSKGLGIEKDIKTAESYYQMLINKTRNIIPKNLTKAYFELALLYLYEFQNEPQARRNFRYAADRGHKEAQYQYAKMCYNGKGGLKDFKDAVEYYNKAAQQGHKEAQEWLKIHNKIEQKQFVKPPVQSMSIENEFKYELLLTKKDLIHRITTTANDKQIQGVCGTLTGDTKNRLERIRQQYPSLSFKSICYNYLTEEEGLNYIEIANAIITLEKKVSITTTKGQYREYLDELIEIEKKINALF